MKPREPWVPYAAPFGVYMLFLLVQSRFEPDALVWLYPLKTIATAITLVMFWRSFEELRGTNSSPAQAARGTDVRAAAAARNERQGMSRGRGYVAAVVVGALVIIIWIGIDPYYPGITLLFAKLSTVINSLTGGPTATPELPAGFDPFTITQPVARWMFIAFRVFGATVVVAFMEELFWRGFLIRWLIREDFKSVPVGTFTWSSFVITVAFFGLEHDQWLAGLICGVLYNALYYRTRNLRACVLAHATSNALLAAWVLTRHDWKFW